MTNSNRIDDIEILRGFAIIFVVLHHLNGNLLRFNGDNFLGVFFQYFNGSVGVDLFFAISGFVIARSLVPQLRDCDDHRDFFRTSMRFWIRRAFRLLPSAWVWLIVILFLQLFFNSSQVYGSLIANLEATLAAFLQLANLRFAYGFGSYELGVSFVYWSLSLEEQFYLLFPLVVFFSGRWLPQALLCIVALQLFQERGLLLMSFRTDAICLGVLIALFHGRFNLAHFLHGAREHRWLITFIAISVLILMCIANGKALKFPFLPMSFVALASAVLVFIASLDANFIRSMIPYPRIFLWVGSRSYAIYLIHIPLFYAGAKFL